MQQCGCCAADAAGALIGFCLLALPALLLPGGTCCCSNTNSCGSRPPAGEQQQQEVQPETYLPSQAAA
jgi:hypothetical protein